MSADPTAGLTAPLQVIARFRDHDFTLHDFLRARVEAQPDGTALEFEGRAWSYGQLDGLVARWAGWLAAKGVAAGDTLAVMAQNDPNTVALLFAAARLGAILVPVNPDYGVPEARYVLDHAQVRGVVVSPDRQPVAEEALEAVPNAQGSPAWVAPLGAALEAEIAAAAPWTAGRGDADDCCLIIYTSGTTGFPKGAMHGQRGFVLTAEAFVERLWLQPDERVMCVMPMFHVNALMYSVGGGLACGGTIVLVRRFSASGFWRTVAETRSTEVNLVAAAGSILVQRPRSEFVPGHGLAKMFVAPQTRAMVDSLRDELEVPLLIECYGMTEIPGVISNPFAGPHILGTMGVLCRHPDPRIERPRARIVDEDGQDVPPGTTGELLVRTPTVMQGYYRDPGQTEAAFQNGWFRTGDLVRLGEDGFYRFVARKKDIIRRRGENVASAEVERTIAECAGVADVAVIGVPSPLGEEDILAAVVPAPGAPHDAAAIIAWTRARLSAPKVPRYVAFVDAIPLTPTHKPAKHRLREDPTLMQRAIDMATPA
ncbi:class I adenylate-forming enzyme family protein [Muricoccus pecuniae]|uniref:Crotonobetaine/carnitine-CoA ligase n=1 Tax=Muricoccus pecuniae TaxID=693023 RepID=A0A840YMR8_9PROT|nr:class I adenylate-forming enzyme family protein [Roseomonas pecuniae]MBB5696393.1 crotonobetaine/carnitine-CoA ligase [Roseomonas pecuniae]